MRSTTDPVLGGTLTLQLDRVVRGSLAALGVGSPPPWPGLVAGCAVHVDLASAFTLPTPAGGGSVTLALPVPAAGALRGVTFAAQAWLVTPGAAFETSGAVHLTPGS